MLSHMKRTTLILDSGLYAQLRRRALQEHRTLTEMVERCLRAGLSATSAARQDTIVLPSFDLGPFLVEPSAEAWDGATDEETRR